uniref:V-SNARE coiled-coil homology domain-containing protein n=1 Tax=Chromulina nebulosa TaxID=96789 RepID=A0A7S0SW64_9STRA|mmetsp:Transcript_4937/g.4427  ORF Transcript_4937/g.4427 Transcript_4937/m.4427 type:complete len:233 (+) Transcript_4937:38-736(+)
MSGGTYFGNVYFLGIARLADKAYVIASLAYNSETDIDGIKKVLEQPNMNMSPGKHYSFTVGQVLWNLIADDSGLIYIMIVKSDYPIRTSHACLEELQRSFSSNAGDRALTAKDKQLNSQYHSLLQKFCEKYDNLSKVDSLAAVSKKVDQVKLVMQENVDLALQNCVKLESIERSAEELQQQAGVFKKNANELRKKMWWKNIKMKLIIGGVILVIIAIIVAVIAVEVKSSSGK